MTYFNTAYIICTASPALRSRMKQFGIMNKEIAHSIGVSVSYFSEVLSGKRNITEENAQKILVELDKLIAKRV